MLKIVTHTHTHTTHTPPHTHHTHVYTHTHTHHTHTHTSPHTHTTHTPACSHVSHTYHITITCISRYDLPLPLCRSLNPVAVSVDYTSVGADGLQLVYPYGFEMVCGNDTAPSIEGTAIKVIGGTAIVEFSSPCPGGVFPSAIYYCWRTDPCSFKMCPIYSESLPSPPFYLPLT